MSGLVLRDVVKRFGTHAAIDGLSLSVDRGEIVALLGPSGCGKTTTLRAVAGFEAIDRGAIAILGADVARLPPYRRDIGLVFQDYALFPHMSVAANIEYGLRQRGVARAAREQRRKAMLRLVRLEGLDERTPAKLSGGQQQRVALARALAIAPKLLLLDEPLSNLDAKLREALRGELRAILREAGATTLVVTHDQTEAMGLADRIALMNHGRLVQVGTARELYERPATRFAADFIGQSVWFSGTLRRGADGAEFATEDGPVLPICDAGATVGSLSIRPEYLHLPPRPGDVGRIAVTVTEVGYFGAELSLACRLASGRVIRVPLRSDGAAVPRPGAQVELGVAPERCRIIADDPLAADAAPTHDPEKGESR
ncbi:MAG TPA: ABC transporter ATP-binding protein [Xanthobacteraceae bacterium]|nr:ABC transporter ATP-binding protein [Xanthobacteraceae bacterium]